MSRSALPVTSLDPSKAPDEYGAAEASVAEFADVLALLDTTSAGLTSAEASRRLAEYGPPNAVRSHRVSATAVLARQLKSAILALLAVTAVISFFLGDRNDAVIIGIILTASIGLGFTNEYRAERASAALHSQVRHTAVTLRDGSATEVDVADLVLGDILRLTLGSVVPADLRLIAVNGLECDESMLSGESLPAPKSLSPLPYSPIPLSALSTKVTGGAPFICPRTTMTIPRQAPRSDSIPGSDARATTLPLAALLPLTATAFLAIVTETLPAGLLLQISSGLTISESAAGQMVSVYALGAVIAAIPAITLTRGLRRKPILLAVVTGGMLLANTITAVVDSFTVTLVARFVAGAFSGVLWGMLAGYTRKITPAAKTGKALAIAMPARQLRSPSAHHWTYLGSALGWRWAFTILAVFSAILLVWIVGAVPDAPRAGTADPHTAPTRCHSPRCRDHTVHRVRMVSRAQHAVHLHRALPDLRRRRITGRRRPSRLRLRIRRRYRAHRLDHRPGTAQDGAAQLDRICRRNTGPRPGRRKHPGATCRRDPVGRNLCRSIDPATDSSVGRHRTRRRRSQLHVDHGREPRDLQRGGTTGGILLDNAGPGLFPWAALAVIVVVFALAFAGRRAAIVPGRRTDRLPTSSS